MKQLTYEEALAKATAYCARSEKSESDVMEKFYTWGMEEGDRQKIMEYLRSERYVDNSRFAEAYVRDKFRFNRWGRKKIAMMLASKGISRTVISEALEIIDDEAYFETLQALLQEKSRTIKDTDTYQRSSKLFAFAMQRGFETGLIKLVIENIGNGE